ncbi:hypothetical protein BRPE64_CCDS04840 [Caballeronia insecticola]|uniref:Uncharacterized protein n=1 Tax=Caballeronia insecticola TaxID=758793 RepID=R4X3P3_9BURK|nr:hypothetical protein BRPE64_CCDS04840 [Caballeronia insecticola]
MCRDRCQLPSNAGAHREPARDAIGYLGKMGRPAVKTPRVRSP